MARRIRVWQRASADSAAAFDLRLQTDANVEQSAHALTATRDARPVLAYVRAEFAGGLQRPAYRYPLRCCVDSSAEVFDLGLPFGLSPMQAVEQIRLVLIDDSPSDARIVLRYRNAPDPHQHEV